VEAGRIIEETYAFMRNYNQRKCKSAFSISYRVPSEVRPTPAVPYSKTLPSGFVYCNAASVIAFLTAGEAMAVYDEVLDAEVVQEKEV